MNLQDIIRAAMGGQTPGTQQATQQFQQRDPRQDQVGQIVPPAGVVANALTSLGAVHPDQPRYMGGQQVLGGAMAAGPPGKLPPIGDNYVRPLSELTPTVHHETNFYKAQEFIPEAGVHTGTPSRLYLSNDPDLALGQGDNKGIKLEFSTDGLSGRYNTAKPSTQLMHEQGKAEFLGDGHQKDWQRNLKSVTIDPAINLPRRVDKILLQQMIERMKKNGWADSTDPETGHLKLEKR